FEVQEFLRIIDSTPTSNCEIKGVTTRGGKTKTHDIQKDDTYMNGKEPPEEARDKLVESNEVLMDQPQETNAPVVQQSIKEQTPLIPFPRRLGKEKEEAQQRKFLENLKNPMCRRAGVIYVSSFTIYFMLTIPKNNTLTGIVPGQL
nr:hypothetical protein [Tanacetum cinerariifolium]